MDGLLIVDKPAGITSHDVVMRARRLLGERRIGHTGTLDPAATGVLPLVVGRATRLARFLSAGDKEYDAVIRLGISTDTGDAEGRPLERLRPAMPGRGLSAETIDRALDAFRGTFLQQPPAFSAKKVGGKRSHRLARSARPDLADPPGLPAPAKVTVHALDVVALEGDDVSLHIHCSAGFYVRSLAHDLGERLETGAHLWRLRRTRSGESTIADAAPLETLEADPRAAADRLIPLARVLPGWPALTLTADGVRKVVHGLRVPAEGAAGTYVRLVDEGGGLVGIGRAVEGTDLLHPIVVLM